MEKTNYGLAKLEYLRALYRKKEFEGGSCREDPDPEEEEEVLIFLFKLLCLGDCMRMMNEDDEEDPKILTFDHL
eukprot:58262-Heterocapsa_arctica.AAC.1